MSGNVEVTVKMVDNSPEYLEALEKAKGAALEALGQTVERYAKEKCPVDTGRLRNSIAHTTDDDTVVCGTNVEYAAYV